VVTQGAHSIEEYEARLWEVLAPARLVSGLVSSNLPLGFAVVNALLVLFGFWCYWTRIRGSHRSGPAWAWFWTIFEGLNGVGHLALAAQRGGYFAGAATAPVLLMIAVWLGVSLARDPASHPS
jgi:hypothetical protein